MPGKPDFDLDDAFRHTKFVPQAAFTEDLRARLRERTHRRNDPAFSSNGRYHPLSIPNTIHKQDRTMSNSRLIPMFAAGFALVLVMVLGAAVLLPGELPDLLPAQENESQIADGEFVADDLGDIAGVWARATGNWYIQFNLDGTGHQDRSFRQIGEYFEAIPLSYGPASEEGHFAEWNIWFEDGVLRLEYINVDEPGPVEAFEVHILMDSNTPVSLRFVGLDEASTEGGFSTVPFNWLGPAAPTEDN
jgi:hypothetical protein